MDAYDQARKKVGGKLKLKRSEGTTSGGGVCDDDEKKRASGAARRPQKKRKRQAAAEEAEEVPVVKGSGRVVSSGATLRGFETQFKEEVCEGDEIMLHHPSSLMVESRVVLGVMTQRSLTLNEGFTSDLISTSAYHIKKDSERLKRLAEKRRAEETAAVGSGDGAPAPSDDPVATDDVSKELMEKLKNAQKYKTVTYREKTGMWGYRTVTERVKVDDSDDEKAATGVVEKELDIRAKKMGRDKFCW